jgi:hypothetical protein
MTRTLVIDLRFRGVGRICLACGTTNPKIKAKYERMLHSLYDDGRVDILRSIRDRLVSFAEAYDSFRRGQLTELATGETAKKLTAAWNAWAESSDAGKKHRSSFVTSGRYLERADSKARIGDLPRLLRKLRETLGVKHPRSFNLLRSHVSAFVRDTLTKAHHLYPHVTAVQPRTTSKKRKGRPLSIEQMVNYFGFPATDETGSIAWSMATSGMGQGELWGDWSVHDGRIHIEGTKREGRVRDVPLFLTPTRPTIHRRTFENRFRERTGRVYQPYDLRRTYANWLERASVPRARRKLYMGHGASDVTDLYEHHEVREFLASDAAKLAQLLPTGSVKSPVILPLKKRKGA